MKPTPPKNRSVKGTQPAQTDGPYVVSVVLVCLLCFIGTVAIGLVASQPQSNSECRSHD